jgi:hypothetical protein
VVLNKENRDCKFFLIFDIRRNAFIRRIQKKEMDQESFAIDHTGRMLLYSEEGNLYLKLCRLPNSAALNQALKPRYIN